MKNTLKVGLAQINPTVGDFEGNKAKICSFIEKAERRGCDLVVFPELAVSGYPVWDLANKTAFVEKGIRVVKEIARASRKLRTAVVLGFIDRGTANGKRNLNSLAVLENGRILHKQAKTLLPTYDVFLEDIFFSPAKEQVPFSLNGLLLGPTICEDIWDDDYEAKPVQVLKDKGAGVMINIAASPYSREGLERRLDVLKRKAREYGVWLIYVNQVGGQDDLIFDGRSAVVSPKGIITFSAPPFQEGLFVTTVHLRSTGRSGEALPKPDTEKELYEALRLGLKDYIRKNGFRKVVIGLSGGIDSALVAAIARDALGAKSVIGVSFPGPFSSKGSVEDSRELARRLGIEFRVKSIEPQYERFLRETEAEKTRRGAGGSERKEITLAMENLQARLRGLELMYISNDEGALLLTTGNKSELAMGYSTLYGDMCGGLSVIGDVYKTFVYRLARYRNSVSKVIPQAILKKAPSAELRPNQKDSDSLPPYEILDRILYRYIELNESFDEIVSRLSSKGISRQMIRRVLSVVDHNEYKRRQLPPALRITAKAWFGRRMPITNRFDVSA